MMGKHALHTFSCVFLATSACSCGSTDAQLQKDTTYVRTSKPQPVPTVKQAIIKAIELSKGQRLFSQPRTSETPDLRDDTVIYKPVEILGSKQADGSVKVVFSRPTSDVIVAAGRKATKRLLNVSFTSAGVVFTPYTKQEPVTPAGRGVSRMGAADKQDAKFCKAVSIVYSRLPGSDRTEFAASISAKKSVSADDKLMVFVDSVPYTPGGNTGYVLSKDLKIIQILPGA